MKRIVLTVLVCLILTLSACSGQAPNAGGNPAKPASQGGDNSAQANVQAPAATVVPAAQDSTGSAELNTSYENAISIEAQLLIGTFKLVGTDQAVTKEQAAILLPLWKQVQTLSQGAGPGQGAPDQGQQAQGQNQDKLTPQPRGINTETQSQIDELVKQIIAAMTPAQIKAIADMKITQETAMSAMQELGMTVGGPQQGGGKNSGNGQPSQGTPPAGDPGGNSNSNGGQPPSDGQQSGNGAQDGQNHPTGGGMMMVPSPMFDTLVQTLEKIAAG
jgi:hypothetical protein